MSKPKKLEITDTRVREAAKDCPEARRTLQVLFPAAFTEKRGISIDAAMEWLHKIKKEERLLNLSGNLFVNSGRVADERECGEYRCKAFLLYTKDFDWEMKEDREGIMCLIPHPKIFVLVSTAKVRQAIRECVSAREALKHVLPEVIKGLETTNLHLSGELVGWQANAVDRDSYVLASVRNSGEYANVAFALHSRFDWKKKEDEDGRLCLIPALKR